MNYQKLIVEVPPLSDEAAASLHRFFYELMYAIDEHYYSQIQRHYVRSTCSAVWDEIKDPSKEEITDPPF